VTAFDAPGHGLSTGSLSSLRDFVEAFRAVARLVSPVAVIGHSLGAAASVLGLAPGGPVRATVLLAPPAETGSYPRRFARYVRLAPGAADHMEAHLERRLGRLPELHRPECWPGVPVLVFHDRGDSRVPAGEGLAISRSWPETRIVLTRGLGHHRIVSDPAVVRRSVRFLARAAASSGNSAARRADRGTLLIVFGGRQGDHGRDLPRPRVARRRPVRGERGSPWFVAAGTPCLVLTDRPPLWSVRYRRGRGDGRASVRGVLVLGLAAVDNLAA
jgi:hypothetical protein